MMALICLGDLVNTHTKKYQQLLKYIFSSVRIKMLRYTLTSILPLKKNIFFNHSLYFLRIHLSVSQSFSISFYPLQVVGKLKPIPASFGRKAGYTLDMVPVHHQAHRATIYTQKSHLMSKKTTKTLHNHAALNALATCYIKHSTTLCNILYNKLLKFIAFL